MIFEMKLKLDMLLQLNKENTLTLVMVAGAML